MKKILIIFVSVTLLSILSLPASALVVDDFGNQFNGGGSGGVLAVDGSQTLDDPSQQTGLSGVLGGKRDARFELLGNPASATASAGGGIYIDDTGGTSSNNPIVSLDIEYDFGVLNVSGYDSLNFTLTSSSVGYEYFGTIYNCSEIFKATLVDGDSSHTETIVNSASFVLNQVFSFDLTDFASNGINLSQVQSLTFEYDQDKGVNTAFQPGIKQLEFVPEPATLCLLGLGGLMLRRKRKTS